MVTVSKIDEMVPRRPATIAALDARLSVWGQAAREAAGRRAEALVEGAVVYVERVGRAAEGLGSGDIDPASALLDTGYESLIALAAAQLPGAVQHSCRLLWVDPDRLRERLLEALMPATELARSEVRRRQALYRRRARLWQHDQGRLDRLRDELEGMRVPRCNDTAPERVARGLLARHQREVPQDPRKHSASALHVQPGSLARWIAQLDSKIHGVAHAM